MAGRKPDPDSPYRVYLHKDKGYIYASIIESYIRPNGLKGNKHKHIGKVTDDLRFIPNYKYKELTQEEKDSLIFPPEWDLSELDKLKEEDGTRKSDILSKEAAVTKVSVVRDAVAPSKPRDYKIQIRKEEKGLLYGSFWLLQELSRTCGLYDDLLEAFDGNIALVREVLSISFYPYLSGRDYSRFAKWQRTHKTLLTGPLEEIKIEKRMSSISQWDTERLMRQRRRRLLSAHADSSLDTEGRDSSAEDSCVVFILRKDVLPSNSPPDFAAVAYSLQHQEIVYFRSFPWYQKNIDTLVSINFDLESFRFSRIVFMLDEDFSSIEVLLALGRIEFPYFLPISLSSTPIFLSLPKIYLDHFGDPQNMTPTSSPEIYEIKISISLGEDGNVLRHAENSPEEKEDFILHLYLDKKKKGKEIERLKHQVEAERELVEKAPRFRKPPANLQEYQKRFLFHEVKEDFDENNNFRGLSYRYNINLFKERFTICGLFAFLEPRKTAKKADALTLAQLQESLQILLSTARAALLPPGHIGGRGEHREGEDLLDYVSLILFSKLQRACKWEYDSPFDLLDEMESIYFFETGEETGRMSYFTAEQLQICDELGITPPEDSIPTSLKQERQKGKNGRSHAERKTQE